jgi:low temperature requirement protein LtrA
LTTAEAVEGGFSAGHEEEKQRVSPLELFFDLVFVFALTQVTALMSETPTWEGLARGMLILAALWWAWAAYAWLTNYIDTEREVERLLMFASMAAMLVAALAVPNAFEDDGVLFGCAYALVRWLHIFIFAEANEDVDAAGAIRRLARTALPAPALVIGAGFIESDWQYALWLLALAIDFAGPFVFGVRGFQVSAGHFAERFALIVIIALGESIVAIGTGVGGLPLDTGMIAAAALGIALAASLWWAYFDVVALVSERHFRETRGYARARMARDSYSYLHLPMIAGIILIALGVKKTLGKVDEPLEIVPAAALFGGIALYYAGHIGFRLRNVRTLNTQRLVATLLCLALLPAMTEVDALIALAAAVSVTSGLIAYEAIRFREARARVRAAH